jgi:transcriptional regulator with XRE-family HTH domain
MQTLGEAEAQSFGLMIRNQRKAMGLRQEDVALATGVGRRYLIDLEGGKPTARLGPALMIARHLGIIPGLANAMSAKGADTTATILPFLED